MPQKCRKKLKSIEIYDFTHKTPCSSLQIIQIRQHYNVSCPVQFGVDFKWDIYEYIKFLLQRIRYHIYLQWPKTKFECVA